LKSKIEEALIVKAVLCVMCLSVTAPLASAAQEAEYRVASASDIERVTSTLQPGDVLVLADGVWKDQNVVFRGKGTSAKPILLRAQTPGKVVMTGKSSLTMDGDYLVTSGICLKEAGIDGKDGFSLRGSHSRLTDSAVIDSTFKFDVHLYGTENRVDHCYLAGKTSDSPTLQVEVQESPNNHRSDETAAKRSVSATAGSRCGTLEPLWSTTSSTAATANWRLSPASRARTYTVPTRFWTVPGC
jgi:poly(beta-D-mannuronate) lyase